MANCYSHLGHEQNGCATNQIDATEAVFRMADNREPGGALTGVRAFYFYARDRAIDICIS